MVEAKKMGNESAKIDGVNFNGKQSKDVKKYRIVDRFKNTCAGAGL
ncbi:MAG: hypothetical protein L6282_03190 [Candidatus Methanoperedenaceae archaeon]|nr:hypothetical protein [Candidatus Methanoperedenaceae archaeon]